MATPRVPPLVTDLVLGGFWAASAIKVTGYTWSAFSSTWSQLPNPNGQTTQAPSDGIPASIIKGTNSVINTAGQINKDTSKVTGHGVIGTIIRGTPGIGPIVSLFGK